MNWAALAQNGVEKLVSLYILYKFYIYIFCIFGVIIYFSLQVLLTGTEVILGSFGCCVGFFPPVLQVYLLHFLKKAS